MLYAIKGKPVSLDVSKLKSENETFYFVGNSMILIPFWKKKVFPKKLR